MNAEYTDLLVIDPARMKQINEAMARGESITLSEREAYLLGFDTDAEPDPNEAE